MTRRATIDAPWSAPENLGPTINSTANERGPSISADGLTLVFSSDRERDEGKSQLWTSTRKTTAEPWSPPARINLSTTAAFDGEPELSANGLTLLFHSTRAIKAFGKEDLLMCRRKTTTDAWGSPENLGPVVNSSSADISCALSSDSRVLLFSSDRDGGRGRPDLWMSSRPSLDAPWSAPVNLGAPVNSPQDELCPTLSADGRTLIFRGNRTGSLGKASWPDLWMSRRVLKSAATNMVYLDDLPEKSYVGTANLGKHCFDVGPQETKDKRWHLGGRTSEHGLTMIADDKTLRASAVYDLGARYERFTAEVGRMDGTNSRPPMYAEVLADGKPLWKSAPLTDTARSASLSLDVRGVRELTLNVVAEKNYFGSNVLWLDPRLTLLDQARFTNSLGMEFVRVPKGKSWLGGGGGKPGTQEVTIAEDFYLGKYEVTQEEWQKVMGQNPSGFSRAGTNKESVKDISDAELKRFPMEMISWEDTQSFIKQINELSKEAGWVYRLPTETEWEYACRGGPMADQSESAFDFYLEQATSQLLPTQANFKKHLNRTTQVGAYAPNRLGLYDMHGNVWETCADLQTSEAGVAQRVSRGGCWNLDPGHERAASRLAGRPSDRFDSLGLRVARVRVASQAAVWQPLSDGVSFKGWTGETDRWYVDPNQITTNPSDASSHWIFTERAFGDFTLRMQVYCAGKSGVRLEGDSTYLATSLSGGSAVGKSSEFVTKDEKTQKLKFLPSKSQEFRSGESNNWEITRRGSTVTLRINGTLVNEADEKSLPELARLTGSVRIGLESYGGRASFRNIEIRESNALRPEIVP